jgi:hypothetical protein
MAEKNPLEYGTVRSGRSSPTDLRIFCGCYQITLRRITQYGILAMYLLILLRKLALTSLTSGGRLVGIVCSQTQATEFSFSFSDW